MEKNSHSNISNSLLDKKTVGQCIYFQHAGEDNGEDPYLGFVDVLVLILRVKLRLTKI